MPDLAIIVPTRGRPGNVRKVIAAWDFTGAWSDADLVLVADADDPEIQGYRDLIRAADLEELTLIEIPSWLPMVHKLDAAARDLASRYWAVGFAGDDHLPQTIGWAARYLTVLRELGSGMVYGDDGYQGIKLSTEWAVTSDTVRALARMVPASVEHMYCDNAMMDLFGAAGALRHLPEVRIEHMHPVAGKAQTDAQYQRVNHRDQYAKDRAAYEGWKAGQMAADVTTVRSLRPGLPEVRLEIKPVRPAARSAARPVARSGPSQRRDSVPRRLPFPRHFRNVRGATPDEIGVTLADFATQVPADQEIVELGVFNGRTALIMAWGASQGRGAHLTGIDPWDLEGNVYDPPFTDEESKRWAHHWVQSLGYADRITLVQGFSHLEADEWAGPSVGLIFVDGDHTKAGARRDIVTWSIHLAPGAIIAVDDYGHPDWPGVGQAVDELVAEGFLDPIEIFHDRLAVTRLAVREEPKMKPTGTVTAITAEGVATSPYPAMDSQVAGGPASVPEKAVPVHPVTRQDNGLLMIENDVEPEVDISASTAPGLRVLVSAGELDGVAEGTEITELGTYQLRTLAKVRGIVLGVRKDKRDAMLQAITDGE